MPGAMEFNKSPISVSQGKVLINGVEVGDGFSCKFKFTPKTWSGTFLGEMTENTRWLGGSWSGEMSRGRTNGFIKDAIKNFLETGITPEITIQGIANDKGSDYYAETGKEDVVTAVGCVLTGDLTLLDLDTGGDILKDTIQFKIKKVIFG